MDNVHYDTYLQWLNSIDEYNGQKVLQDKLKVPVPVVVRVNRSSMWTNMQLTAEQLNRTTDHMVNFVTVELSCKTSVTGDSQLCMGGKFNSKNIQNVLTKYIRDYVQCPQCLGGLTRLEKDAVLRTWFVVCDCGGKKSVK